ncbi:glycosyltransferase family A protein [Pseudarthrobacter sp. PvP090]|uniref:glycosyltransferase family 2 protein n=1 Tax=Pseudarthrobacter sp. PvP090 TaxID=3156393 RepID=UPI003390B53E
MKLQQTLRRLARLSPKKKAAAAVFAILFALVVVAAYARNPWLLGLLGLAFAAALAVGALYMDRLLKTSRRAAQRAAAELAKPAPLQDPRPGALVEWGARARIPEARLAQRLTKLRSVDGRDVLVASATMGRWGWRDMSVALEMYRIGGKSRRTVQPILDKTPRSVLLHLGDLCFRQNILQDDILNAATLYKYVFQRLGAKPFREKRRAEFFLDALARTGQGEDVVRFLSLYNADENNSNDLHLYLANASNPFKDRTASLDAWLIGINDMYQRAGLSRITLTDGPSSAFLRLSAETPAPVTDGPLVTIVMPVYRPDEFTDLAIQSAIDQSYQNLEIIIVDDGSGGDAAERLNKWLAVDRRIQVVLNEPNAGAYTSRNIGYSMAHGEYITIFDGDDWQHPQKIELLVRGAQQQTDGRLVSAPWTRADEDLFFHYRGWRGAFITPAHVSTMFHTPTIREHLGHWDSVRKAADTEFILRYQALVNGEEPLEVCEAPLTLSLVGESNLSMEDFRLGYRSPDRVSYRDSYEHWHKKIHSGEHSGYLDFPLAERAFPAPSRFLPTGAKQQDLELDILFVGDFGAETAVAQLMLEHISAAGGKGQRVGLMHYPSILHTASIDRSFSRSLKDAFHDGRLIRVEVTDRVRSAVVNVYDPTAFQYSRELRSGHAADRVSVWTDEPPYNWETDEHKYEVGTVERNLLSVFNGSIRWVPLNERTQRIILQSGHGQKSIGDHVEKPNKLTIPDSPAEEAPLALTGSNVGAFEAGETP